MAYSAVYLIINTNGPYFGGHTRGMGPDEVPLVAVGKYFVWNRNHALSILHILYFERADAGQVLIGLVLTTISIGSLYIFYSIASRSLKYYKVGDLIFFSLSRPLSVSGGFV